jgi:hypothetical protein
MQMLEKHGREIEKIMADSECPVDFACYRSGFEDVCKAEDSGLDGFAYCQEEAQDAQRCRCSLSFGYRYLCKCRLRIYAARHLNV